MTFSSPRYRKEIDGLRAIAVIPVILFHGEIPGFSGGFIGVDIFFVISGYLITSNLIRDLEARNFKLQSFYERRARRILPALVFVTVCIIPIAWLWMLPSQLKDFGKSIAAVALFVSNILLWRQSGYFDAAAELKPMLHTWSLSVEEQYYIMFPCLLWGIWRYNKKIAVPTLLTLSTLSLILAEWGSRSFPVANFYLAPTRFWELLVGGLCAHRLWFRKSGASRPVAATVGLSIIIFSMFLFSPSTPMPSFWAILPVGGTALIILFSSPDAKVTRLLSLPPFVLAGWISYSAYLWHQPLLALARVRYVDKLPSGVVVGIISTTFILAWFTWRFVERPFRTPDSTSIPEPSQPGLGPRHVLLSSAGALLTLLVAGTILWRLDGVPSRHAPSGVSFEEVTKIEQMLRPNRGLNDACDAGGFTLSPFCRTGSDPSVVLWGDSFAMHLAPALSASLGNGDFVQHTLSACGPFATAFVNRPVTPWRKCQEFNQEVFSWIAQQPSVKTVILSSAFQQFSSPVFDDQGNEIRGSETIRSLLVNDTLSLSKRLRSLGKRVVFVSPPPVDGNDLGLCFLRRYLVSSLENSCQFLLSAASKNYKASVQFLSEISREVPVIWPEKFICPAGVCKISIDEIPLYRDSGHLSIPGSAKLGEKCRLFDLILSAAR